MNVVATDGSPDATIQITVRGGGSITQDNSPLYIEMCIRDSALGCQRTIAEKVIKGEGDYIFIVKDNQPKLKETVLSATESILSLIHI